MKPVYFLIAIFFIAACSSASQSNSQIEETKAINPLDKILGDKLVNEKSGEIRQNNFIDFLSISSEDLLRHSDLYEVTPVGAAFYLIHQKKMYTKARTFSAILKVDGENIVKYHVMDDFNIVDYMSHSKGLSILYGNFGNYNEYWKTSNDIQLVRFDNNLNQQWRYAPKSDIFPLKAIEITNQYDYTSATIDLVTGCHVCTNTFVVKIDGLGNCFSAVEIFKTNSSAKIDKQSITKIFVVKNTGNHRPSP